MRRRTVLGCLAAMAITVGLPARGHDAEDVARFRPDADAAAPAFGTAIDFELIDPGGHRVRAADLRGRWLLLFFGYTSCPDLCPTALSEVADALAGLGKLALRVQPVFVSIDPERDTPRKLRDYVEAFDKRILALTGNVDQLAQAANSSGVVFYKVPGATPEDYTFAHNAVMTLVGPEGGIVTRFSTDATAEVLAESLRKLIDGGNS